MEENTLESLAKKAKMEMTVPALKGNMGGLDYYVITLPFAVAARYLTETDKNLPPKLRENRKVSPQRFAEIAKYIKDYPEDYRFSALTCTFGKDQQKEPLKWESPAQTGDASFIGMLTLDQKDPLIIVDGQHRFGAIKKVLDDNPDLGDERITIVLFPYISVKHAQQLFSDLNRTAKKTTKSLDILFNHRDVVNRVVQKLVDNVSVFKGRVNLEDQAVARQSEEMFTIATIYQATKPIVNVAREAGLLDEELAEFDSETGAPKDNEKLYVDFLTNVWEFIAEQFPEWGKVASGKEDIRNIRSQYLHWHSGVISAVGEFVAEAMRQKGKDWQTPVKIGLTHPQTHGWRRDAEEWQGIITAATQVMPRSLVRPSLKSFLKKLAGLILEESDKKQLEAVMKMKGVLKVSVAV